MQVETENLSQWAAAKENAIAAHADGGPHSPNQLEHILHVFFKYSSITLQVFFKYAFCMVKTWFMDAANILQVCFEFALSMLQRNEHP